MGALRKRLSTSDVAKGFSPLARQSCQQHGAVGLVVFYLKRLTTIDGFLSKVIGVPVGIAIRLTGRISDDGCNGGDHCSGRLLCHFSGSSVVFWSTRRAWCYIGLQCQPILAYDRHFGHDGGDSIPASIAIMD